MSQMNRRDFLRRGAGAGAAALSMHGLGTASLLGAPAKRGPNGRIRLGVIGTGGRARQLVIQEKLYERAEVVAIADCFLKRCEMMLEELPAEVARPRVYQDYRQMLEKEKLDGVFIPTTTHARALIAIQAMQAGLDVYAEKPIALTVQEGRALIKAARKLKRVFQAGTQQRSMPINVFASKLVRDGAIGKIREVVACNFFGPEIWTPKPAEPMPTGLDWDQWCNQTELRPYHSKLQFGWAKWRDFDGSGISWGVSGWGTHAFDQVQCALGTDDTTPVEIWPAGEDEQGIMKVTMKYPDGTLLKAHGPRRNKKECPELPDLGAIFVGEKGRIEIKRGQVDTDRPDLFKDGPGNHPSLQPGETVPHIENFLECMRTRKKPNADVEIAHRSTIVCILMNVCRELNRTIRFDPKTERFIDDAEADRQLARERRKGFELPAEFI